ncbi:MAG: hypothetical protein Q9187_002561 [Circinaria calcarea]
MAAQRESPRDAIRNWLAHTEQAGGTREVSIARDEGRDGHRSRSRHRHRQRRSERHHEADNVSMQGPKSNTIHKARITENLTGVEVHDSSGLAKRLGLHPPFQAMDLKQVHHEKRLGHAGTTRDRKRKRSSSGTSYLEPAVIDEPIKARNDLRNRDAIQCPKSSRGLQEDESEKGPSSSTSSSSCPSPVKPAKTYERRARHKTKEDRYELKQDKKSKKTRPKTKETTKREASRKDRKRKAQSGAALLHKFTAKNVASNRLTMRPTAKLGLFTKGRASSPVQRRGLPDLSFSEMTFLNARGKPEEPLNDVGEKKRSRKSKASNLNDEISRFFASTREPLVERSHNISSHAKELPPLAETGSTCRQDVRHLSVARSSLPPIKLPGRPFLGFGEPGPRPSSPLRDLREDISVSDLCTRRQPQSGPSRSATYYTWSQSPEPARPRLMTRSERDLATKGSKGSLDRGRAGRSLGKASSSQINNHHTCCCGKCSTKRADDGLRCTRIMQEGDPIDPNGSGKPDISTRSTDHQRELEDNLVGVCDNDANIVHSGKFQTPALVAEVLDTQLPENPEVTPQTNEPNKSIGEDEPFSDTLDAIFENVQAELPPLPTTKGPSQEVIEEGFNIQQPAYQTPSPLKNKHQGTPTTHGIGSAPQAVKGQTGPAQTVLECRHSPYTKEIAMTYPQHTLSGYRTAHPPRIFAPVPSQAPISGYGRPATIYGQQIQSEDSRAGLPYVQDRDDRHSSISRGSRSLTARPYGTPVSLESRPSEVPERLQGSNLEPGRREDWHYNNHLHEKGITEDTSEGQAAIGGCSISRNEPLDRDIIDDDIHYGSHVPFNHHEYINVPEELNSDPRRSRLTTACSHSPSFVSDFALPSYQAQRNLGSRHRPVTARSSRQDQPAFTTGISPEEPSWNLNCRTRSTVSRDSIGEREDDVRQDEDLGPVGFWKPNRLY